MSTLITKQLLLEIKNEPIEIPEHFKHRKFTAFVTGLGEYNAVTFIIDGTHYLVLNEHLTSEEQQKLIENYWLEEFIPCRVTALGTYLYDSREDRGLEKRYDTLFGQMLTADDRETRHHLLIELHKVVAKKVYREIKNSYLAGLRDEIKKEGVR